MKRSYLLIILLLALAGAVYYFTREDPYSTLGKDNDFAVRDTAKIGKIFIADRDGASVTLKKNSKYWFVNDGYRANPAIMENLMRVIYGMEVLMRPPQAAVPSMVKSLAANAYKVQIFNTSNELIRAYYVGGVTPNEGGTYMIMEGSEQPYVTGVKNRDGGLRANFFTEIEKWRDKTLFEYKVDDIKTLSLEYPKLRNRSFQIFKKNGQFQVYPLFSTTPKSKEMLSNSRVEAYLRNYKSIIAEAFANEVDGKDSITQMLPFAIFKIEDVRGKRKEVKLYPIIPTNKQGFQALDNQGNAVPPEKYFTIIDNKDAMITQELLMGKVLWAYDYFFDKK